MSPEAKRDLLRAVLVLRVLRRGNTRLTRDKSRRHECFLRYEPGLNGFSVYDFDKIVADFIILEDFDEVL